MRVVRRLKVGDDVVDLIYHHMVFALFPLPCTYVRTYTVVPGSSGTEHKLQSWQQIIHCSIYVLQRLPRARQDQQIIGRTIDAQEGVILGIAPLGSYKIKTKKGTRSGMKGLEGLAARFWRFSPPATMELMADRLGGPLALRKKPLQFFFSEFPVPLSSSCLRRSPRSST